MSRQVIDTVTDNGTYKGDPAKVAFEKSNSNFQELYDTDAQMASDIEDLDSLVGALLTDAVQLIIGFKMIYVGPNSLTISAGVAFVPGLNKRVVLSAASAKTGIVVPAGTWLHGYVFESAPGVADTEWSTIAPAAPYSGTARTKAGDTTRRYIGSVRSGAANVIYKFKHVLADGSVTYDENTAVAPFVLVSAGTATSATAVSAAAVVPLTGVKLSATILNAATGAYLHISNSAGPVAGSGFITMASPGGLSATSIPLDGSQQYTYAYETSPGAGASYQRANGYTFER